MIILKNIVKHIAFGACCFIICDAQAMHRKLSAVCGVAMLRCYNHATLNTHGDLRTGSPAPATPVVTNDLCHYVLRMSKLPVDESAPAAPYAFATLDGFFSKAKVRDYADAAGYGRQNAVFDDPDAFNTKMGSIFKSNSVDIVPQDGKKYQAIIFATSGIDVFMERLAFLSRLTKNHKVQADDIVALVGNHAHRKDLQNVQYLVELPKLFAADFSLATCDASAIEKDMKVAVAQKDWLHRDGMEVAWKLVSCDPMMEQLRTKFRYFPEDRNPDLRTEQLMQQVVATGLRRPVTPEYPIAFIVNAQGAAKTKEMIKKYFEDNGSVDLLIARPVAEEVEGRLYNDTPQQRAMTKLFHFYRILETVVQKDAAAAK